MIIELHGAGFANKGGHLMLLAALERFSAATGNVTCCLEASPLPRRLQALPMGLRFLWPSARVHRRLRSFAPFFRISTAVSALVRPAWIHPYGLVRWHDVDALVDISGFAFGEAQGIQRLKNMVQRARFYKRRGRPVILLPQMLGPFESPQFARKFSELVEHSDLVFARDEVSLKAARSVVGKHENVRLAPDITISHSPAANSMPPAFPTEYACLVPNMHVLDKGDDRWRQHYESRLVRAGRRMIHNGLRVVVMIHESSGEDEAIGRRIHRELGDDVTHLSEQDPQQLKAILAGARFLVGSRFHSLVGALSSGVPAVAIGWAHKYETLMDDFGMRDFVHSADDSPEHLEHHIDRLCDVDQWSRLNQKILDRKSSIQLDNERMWAEVFQVLGLGVVKRNSFRKS